MSIKNIVAALVKDKNGDGTGLRKLSQPTGKPCTPIGIECGTGIQHRVTKLEIIDGIAHTLRVPEATDRRGTDRYADD